MKSRFLGYSVVVFVVACAHYTILTSAQLDERGTRKYANTTQAKATEAFATGLATLGYNVAVKQPEAGLVKTAPKTMVRSATAVGEYAANETDDALAWTIHVEDTGGDVVVHATPHAFRNGSEMHDENTWAAETLDPWFRDLWSQTDDILGKPVSAYAPSQQTAK